ALELRGREASAFRRSRTYPAGWGCLGFPAPCASRALPKEISRDPLAAGPTGPLRGGCEISRKAREAPAQRGPRHPEPETPGTPSRPARRIEREGKRGKISDATRSRRS